jgi:hypothetical protein
MLIYNSCFQTLYNVAMYDAFQCMKLQVTANILTSFRQSYNHI